MDGRDVPEKIYCCCWKLLSVSVLIFAENICRDFALCCYPPFTSAGGNLVCSVVVVKLVMFTFSPRLLGKVTVVEISRRGRGEEKEDIHLVSLWVNIDFSFVAVAIDGYILGFSNLKMHVLQMYSLESSNVLAQVWWDTHSKELIMGSTGRTSCS